MSATDWGGGARRRTEVGGQAFWRIATRTTSSVFVEVDLPSDGAARTSLTTLYASLYTELPAGFRGGLSVESHQPILLWNPTLVPDTTIPLPGRIAGYSLTLGHRILGFNLDVTGGSMKRAGDARPTLRGTVALARGLFYLNVFAQHGDLMDYESALVRLALPPGALPVTLSLGALASVSRTAGGGTTFVRYSFRPEVSRYIGAGLFASMGGDIGRYAGETTTWLHAGVSYRIR